MQYKDLAKSFGPEAFSLRVTEKMDVIGACRYTTYLEPEVTDASLDKQIKTFFKLLHPFIVGEETLTARGILCIFRCNKAPL